MAQSAVIREEFTYAGHNAVINTVCYNRLHDCFVSSDDTNLRLWQPTTKTPSDLRVVVLPPRTAHFIQSIVFLETRHVYVASALDGTLKIYDHELNEVASVFSGRSAILSLVFDVAHSRLFTGGVDGCAAWDVRGKPLLGPESVLNPLYDLAACSNFFHYAATVSSSNTFVLPTEPRASFVGVPPSSTTFAVASSSNSNKKRALKTNELAWVQSVQLNSDQTRLYAVSKHRVDVFSTQDGHHIDTFVDLVPPEHGAITAFVVHEKTQYLVCGCINGYLFVLSVHPTSTVHVFKDHTMAVTGLAVHLSSHLIISSSLDGTVRLWDLEARRQAHRLDIRQPVHELGLLTPTSNPCRFYCRVRSAVRLFTIQSAAKEQLSSLSPISVLQRVLFPTALTTKRHDSLIPGEKLSSTRHLPLTLPRTQEGVAAPHDGQDTTNASPMQWIVAAGTDRTIRLFSGRAANEAPSFTWIPEEHALDVGGLSLHAEGHKLFILLDSQKLLIVDILKKTGREDDDENGGTETKRRRPHRLVDMDASPLSIVGSNTAAVSQVGASTLKKSIAALAAASGDTPTASTSSACSSSGGLNGSTNVAANPALRGAIRSICCCYYPPIFRSAASTTAGSVVGGSDATAQLKWFSRTFVNRRQQSKRDLKKLDDLTTNTTTSSHSPTKQDTDRTPLVQSDREWVVCGSEFGHLVFWHSGLTNSFHEAISLDAHDAGVVAIAASASSPLCVSLDANKRVHIWQFQPVFLLRQMIELNEQPSCFVLSPMSELLLTGYDDGAVVLMNVSDSLDRIETVTGSDENHDAMVSCADFLDAKLIVLTASVDAVIKVWDQNKTLLRQIQIAMALTCLCFMNDDGDVMAGVSTGIFMLSKDDLLPEKLPVHETNGSPSSRQKKRPFWLEDGAETDATRHSSSSGSPPKKDGGQIESPLKTSAMTSASAHKARQMFQKRPAVSFQDPTPSDPTDSPTKQDELSPSADRTEAQEEECSPRKASTALPLTWKRRNLSDSLALLMGSKTDGEAARLKTLHPPVLRPLNNQQPARATPASRPPSSRTLFPAKDPDWREVIMPSSPLHANVNNQFAQRNRRLKPPSASSAIIAELKALAHAAPQLSSPSRATSPRAEPRSPRSDGGDPPSPHALGIGHTQPAPLQYCKHQAPVPPKAKTPRKLWNAIGGEDRRLIAVQRNLPSLS